MVNRLDRPEPLIRYGLTFGLRWASFVTAVLFNLWSVHRFFAAMRWQVGAFWIILGLALAGQTYFAWRRLRLFGNVAGPTQEPVREWQSSELVWHFKLWDCAVVVFFVIWLGCFLPFQLFPTAAQWVASALGILLVLASGVPVVKAWLELREARA